MSQKFVKIIVTYCKVSLKNSGNLTNYSRVILFTSVAICFCRVKNFFDSKEFERINKTSVGLILFVVVEFKGTHKEHGKRCLSIFQAQIEMHELEEVASENRDLRHWRPFTPESEVHPRITE